MARPKDDPTEPIPEPTTAEPTPDVELTDDPTLGGALPDPADDSPRGRFNRGEITVDQLAAELDDAAE